MNLETIVMTYDIMLDLYQKNIISEALWYEYCEKTLEKLMIFNKKVLDNLK